MLDGTRQPGQNCHGVGDDYGGGGDCGFALHQDHNYTDTVVEFETWAEWALNCIEFEIAHVAQYGSLCSSYVNYRAEPHTVYFDSCFASDIVKRYYLYEAAAYTHGAVLWGAGKLVAMDIGRKFV